jgi:hypothetical protein
MAGIDIEGLATVYPNGVRAVDGLDLTVADGEFFALQDDAATDDRGSGVRNRRNGPDRQR